MMQSSLLATDGIKRNLQPGDRLVLFLPVFLGLGAGLYFLLPFEPTYLWSGFIGAIALAALTRRLRDRQTWRYGAAFLVLFFLGLSLAQQRTQSIDTKLLTQRQFNAEVTGTITSLESMGQGWRVVLSDATVDHDSQHYNLRITLRAKDLQPVLGDAIQLRASLLPPSPPLLPGMYDFQRHAFFHGLSGYGYATKVLDYKPQTIQQQQNILNRYRAFLSDRVYQNLQQPESGIVTALLNGQRGGIARKTTTSLQQSGLQHIISISGLHVGLLAGIVFFTTRFLMACSMTLALRWPIKKIAAVFALLSIVFYMLVVGDDPATLRAVIMAGVALFAVLVDREAINLRVVALAALAILLWRPQSVLDIGFQLSFAAVTALVAFYQFTHDDWQKPMWRDSWALRVLRPVLLSVLTSLIATLATAPLVLYHFQQIPVLSLLSNALATPVVAFVIMPGTFLSYLLTPFPILGDWAIRFMGWGVKLILQISDFITAMKMAVWHLPALPFWPVVCVVVAIFILIAIPARAKLVAAAPFILAILLLLLHKTPDVFITGNRVILIPDHDKGVLYTEGYVDSFSKNLFLQFIGMTKSAPLECDPEVCRLEQQGKTITIIRTVPALAKACSKQVDLLMTRYYLDRPCTDTVVVDRHKTERRGGHSIRLVPLAFDTVYATPQRRPWQVREKHHWNSHGRGGKLDPNRGRYERRHTNARH